MEIEKIKAIAEELVVDCVNSATNQVDEHKLYQKVMNAVQSSYNCIWQIVIDVANDYNKSIKKALI